jgi:hypothetical protein
MRKHEDYLALAYQADEAAARAQSTVARNCWIMLSAEYRKLAAMQLERDQRQQESNHPS